MPEGKANYATTNVPPERTQAELRKVLKAAGCGDIGYREENDRAGQLSGLVAEFTATEEGSTFGYRVRVPFNSAALIRKPKESWSQAEERETRRLWRVLYWQVKRRMEAIEEGISEFRREFGFDIVDPVTNVTVWEAMNKGNFFDRVAIGGPGLPLLESGR